MQAPDGTMVEITQKQYEKFLKHDSRNLARIGDVFKVRQCYFVIETISSYGIIAKGISRREYLKAKKNQTIVNRK